MQTKKKQRTHQNKNKNKKDYAFHLVLSLFWTVLFQKIDLTYILSVTYHPTF